MLDERAAVHYFSITTEHERSKRHLLRIDEQSSNFDIPVGLSWNAEKIYSE